LVISSEQQFDFQAKEFNVNRLKTMSIGLLASTANLKQFENTDKLSTALTLIKEMMLAYRSWWVSHVAVITTTLLLTPPRKCMPPR
jgi:hypothetical protein